MNCYELGERAIAAANSATRFTRNGNYCRAIKLNTKALDLYRLAVVAGAKRSWRCVTAVLLQRGNALLMRGDFEEALLDYRTGARLCEKLLKVTSDIRLVRRLLALQKKALLVRDMQMRRCKKVNVPLRDAIIPDKFSDINGTVTRLKEEVDRLWKDALLFRNIAIVCVLFDLVIIVCVWNSMGWNETGVVIVSGAPSSALVTPIIVSWLCFRHYRLCHSDIRYRQKEMTDSEALHSALSESLRWGDQATISSVVDRIATTDRNLLLKNGQSTVQLEGDKLQAENQYILSSLLRCIQKAGGTALRAVGLSVLLSGCYELCPR